MARKYQVISADGHVETPPDGWHKYVPAKWKDRAPRLVPLPDGGEGWLIENRPMMKNGQNITGPLGALARHRETRQAPGLPRSCVP